MLTDLSPSQRVRIFRAVIARAILREQDTLQDLDAFNAPSECTPIALQSVGRFLDTSLDLLQLTWEVVERELTIAAQLEAQQLDFETPRAHDELCWAARYRFAVRRVR